MKCWNHKNRDAAGICSYCGTAVCRSCALKTPDGRLVCRPACRRSLNGDRTSKLTVQRELTVMNISQVWLLGATAVAFIMFGFFLIFLGLWPVSIYAFVTSVGFVIVGAMWWYRLRQTSERGRSQ